MAARPRRVRRHLGDGEAPGTIDRANVDLPMRPGFEFKGFIPWDYDPETKPQNVQGVLALADQADEHMGGFQCVPELFRTCDTWKLTQPAERDRFKPDGSAVPGDPRGWERTRYARAELTALGEKLLGLRSWDDA